MFPGRTRVTGLTAITQGFQCENEQDIHLPSEVKSASALSMLPTDSRNTEKPGSSDLKKKDGLSLIHLIVL